MAMKRAFGNEPKRGTRPNDFPESQVGFPERNDVTSPMVEMERVHIDLETLDISRKNMEEFTREITQESSAENKG